jgi:hypothetical protein
MQTIGSLRQYKCKRTHQSDDNRINYFNLQEEEVNSELEEAIAPVVMVTPHPRSRSPEVEIAVKESKLSESEPKGMTLYFDSDMSKNTNTVVYFDWKTVIYIYACEKCRTQFMLLE